MRTTFLFLFIINCIAAFAQDSTATQITVSGKVYDAEYPNQLLLNLMVVNYNTNHGVFGNTDGTFTTILSKNDTIVIASTGYTSRKLCFKDSVLKQHYHIQIGLKKLAIQLPVVRILAPRDLDEIGKEIQKLGYNKKDYELSGVNAMSSPITFLYQEFSRREIRHRHGVEFINTQKRRDLLKELLHLYVEGNIIELNDDEFDSFIDYANVSEEFMKSSTQYEFIMYIKKRYLMYAVRRE